MLLCKMFSQTPKLSPEKRFCTLFLQFSKTLEIHQFVHFEARKTVWSCIPVGIWYSSVSGIPDNSPGWLALGFFSRTDMKTLQFAVAFPSVRCRDFVTQYKKFKNVLDFIIHKSSVNEKKGETSMIYDDVLHLIYQPLKKVASYWIPCILGKMLFFLAFMLILNDSIIVL